MSSWLVLEPSVTALLTSQNVTATVTPVNTPDNTTSEFATTTASPTSNPVQVTNATDSTDGHAVGSLRVAILDANNSPPSSGQDHITFVTSSSSFLIQVSSVLALPTITVPVFLDGTSPASFTDTPIVEIEGSGPSFDGLILGPSSGNSTIGKVSIQALDVADFAAGIHVESPNAMILGNYVGTDLTGTVAGPGNAVGILLDNASAATVGGTTVADANTIGFNTTGVQITSAFATDKQSDVVEGNFIGTDAASDNLGNTTGILIDASDNLIGGTASGAGNLIGANSTAGILINSGTSSNVVQGNTIGLVESVTPTVGTPTLVSGTSSTYMVPYIVPGTVGLAYTVNFYLGATSGRPTPQLVGTVKTLALTTSPQSFTTTLTLSAPLQADQTITATAVTLPNGYGVQIVNSNNNMIGGTVPGAPNTIGAYANAGVAVFSGAGNVILHNTYTQPIPGSGSILTTPPATDIVLTPGANNSPPALQLLGAVLQINEPSSSNELFVTVQFSPSLAFTGTVSLDFYQNDESATPASRTFLMNTSESMTQTYSAFTVQIPVLSSFTTSTQILATATFSPPPSELSEPSGTSAFSNEINSTSPITVYTTADNPNVANLTSSLPNGISAIAGSLRFAMSYANLTTPSNQTISFNIPTNDSDYNSTTNTFTISPSGQALPPIAVPVTINGTTEATNQSLPGATIEINGGSQAFDGVTLETGSSGSTIEGLYIADFGAAGIVVQSSNDTIGGATPGDGNTIGSNTGSGIEILAQPSGTGGATVSGNVIEGNDIGTALIKGAFVNLGNGGEGILISASDQSSAGSASADSNIIGGTTTAAGNTIGFNTGAGVAISATQNTKGDAISASNNVVEGNMIGGAWLTPPPVGGPFPVPSPLPNSGAGVLVTASGTVSLGGNTIGGSATTVGGITSEALISSLGTAANYIWDNLGDGVDIDLHSAVLTGTVPYTVEGNLLSRNQSDGAHVIGDLTGDVALGEIINNFIGTDPSGTVTYDPSGAPWGNALSGVLLEQSATVGGGHLVAENVTGNVISGNGLSGVTVQRYTPTPTPTPPRPTASISIAGNIVGLDKTGEYATVYNTSSAVALPMGNALDGILIDNVVGVTIGSTLDLTVPTTTPPSNVISGNLGRGIEMRGDLLSSLSPTPSGGNTIQGNYIGTDASGSLAVSTPPGASTAYNLGNLSDGIFLYVPPATQIDHNLISNNRADGIHAVTQSSSSTAIGGLTIRGNYIGTNKTGESAAELNSPTQLNPSVSLGNGSDGIFLDLITAGATIGGSTPETCNVVSGNRAEGIDLLDSSGIQILGNWVGTTTNILSAPPTIPTMVGSPKPASYTYSIPYTITGTVGHAYTVVFSATNPVQVLGTVTTPTLTSSTQNFTATLTFATPLQNGQIVTASTSTSTPPVVGTPTLVSYNYSVPYTITGTVGQTYTVVFSAANPAQILGTVMTPTLSTSTQTFTATLYLSTALRSSQTLMANQPDLGNAGSGVFLNGSSSVTLGTTGSGNTISGNLASGVFISGAGGSATDNSIQGNFIGVGGLDGNIPIPNSDVGIVLSDTSANTISGNVISANLLDGVLLANTAVNNSISGNMIGTDLDGTMRLGNTADGVFLLGGKATVGGVTSSAGGTIFGNTISGNVISGNAGNGVQIFGLGASGNTVSGNVIGLGAGGSTDVFNSANGIYLNDDGGNNIVGPGNVISNNKQSGVLIFGTVGDGGHDSVVGNFIGTDAQGEMVEGNGGDGVFIYGTSYNTIGGAIRSSVNGNAGVPSISQLGDSNSNLISGNAQAGVEIFSPAYLSPDTPLATGNVVIGDLIGTDKTGSNPIGNNADGVEIYSSTNNTIGEPGDFNVISGNAGNGVLIAQVSSVPSKDNTLSGNFIGIGSDGSTVVANNQNGVLVENASSNTIGATSGGGVYGNTNVPSTASNVISGNGLAGVQFVGGSPNNTVEGDYIGVNVHGTGNAGNGLAGVFVNNLGTASSNETIGGTAQGTGNIISGSSGVAGGLGYGVEILGPAVLNTRAGNVVEGNLIGIDKNSNPVPNSIGVFVQNSAWNKIGDADAPRNVVSGNALSGVEITGLYGTGNSIENNFIGTDISGIDIVGSIPFSTPTTPTPGATFVLTTVGTQQNGVYLLGASSNTVGGTVAGTGNVIGGNITGVDIEGQQYTAGSGVPIGKNVVDENYIGVSNGIGSPQFAVPNYEHGVFINNSSGNTIGGTGSGNTIGANGIDGVEIFGGAAQRITGPGVKNAPPDRNLVIGNKIGLNIGGGQGSGINPPASVDGVNYDGITVKTLDGPIIVFGSQLYGVTVIGSSGNIIGGKPAGQGNTIAGNIDVGVYISRDDYNFVAYSIPTGNTLNSNNIDNNGIYGVLRYEAPANAVALGRTRIANKFAKNAINLADYLKNINNNTSLPAPTSKFLRKRPTKAAPGVQAKRAKVRAVALEHRAKAAVVARPKVPALFRSDAKTVVVKHVARSHEHR